MNSRGSEICIHKVRKRELSKSSKQSSGKLFISVIKRVVRFSLTEALSISIYR